MGRVPSVAALGIAATFQLALVCRLSGRAKLAYWVAALAVSTLVWMWSRKRSRVLLVLLNALLLTIPSLRLWGGGGSGGDSISPSDAATQSERPGGGAAIVADNTFPGVILFPEQQQFATLVPPLSAMRSDIFSPNQGDPLNIPFFGSYWLYKKPQTTLPKNAKVIRGDPDKKIFRSTDLREMRMEAHQNLGAFIDTSCCRAIEIAIRNADRYPGSVSIELTLINTSVAGRPTLSLGSQTVQSTPRRRQRPQGTMLETLTFEIPRSAKLARFDEFSVRYNLGVWRSGHSAAAGIDRFVLLPRH